MMKLPWLRWRGALRRTRPWFLTLLACALPGLILVITCPPLLHAYDGLVQIASRPSEMTILQYPPVYPAFSRLHLYAAQKLGWSTVGKKEPIDLRKSVRLNDAGLRLLLISQQLLLAVALTCLVRTATKRRGGLGLIILLLLSNAALFIPAHMVSTEALAQSLLVFFLAFNLRLFLGGKLTAPACAGYFLLLWLLVLTRHVNAVFAALAPLALLARLLPGLARGPWPWRSFALLLLLGVAAIEGADLATRVVARAFGVTYRETGMRGPSEKLGFPNRMAPAERAAYLAGLQAKTADPVAKEAIPLLAHERGWGLQRAEIETILRRRQPEAGGEAIQVEADRVLGVVVAAYFRSLHPWLLRETAESIGRALFQSSPPDLCEYVTTEGINSLALYQREPWMVKLIGDARLAHPESGPRIDRVRRGWWLALWRGVPFGLLLLLAGAGAGFLLHRKIGEPGRLLFAIVTALIGLLATVLTFVFVHFEPRFTSVANLFAFVALALIAAALVEARPPPPEPSPSAAK